MMMKPWISLLGFLIPVLLLGQVRQGELISQWSKAGLPASEAHNNTYNEVWGLAINGSEYAVIGSTAGTHLINVTDPENPVEDFFIEGSSFGPHIIHRDYHDFRGYLYIVADEDIGTLKSRMQIVDISNLPESIEVVYDNDDRIRKAHNIFIDTAEAKLYAFAVKGGDDPYAPMRVYDIQNPLAPVQLGEFRFELDGLSVNHYHDGFVQNNIAFLNAGFDGLVVADLSDPENPQLLSHLASTDYPDAGYNHSGWLSEDGNYYYLGDETWGTDIKVFDVSDLSNIKFVTKFDAGSSNPFSITHNQIVHCNRLFTSYYYDGLQVFDIQDPSNPVRILEYSTSNLAPRQAYEGAWGVYPFLPSGNILVSDMQNGLFVIGGACSELSSADELALEQEKVSISPNPSASRIQIMTESKVDRFRIYNFSGQIIMDIMPKKAMNMHVDLVESGVYIAEFISSKGRTTKKIVIQR